jgi:hypothetical protein
MASSRQNEGLLKQTLRRDPVAKGACLDAEILAAYFEHSLPANQAKECEVHLSLCAACRAQLAAMVRAGETPETSGQEAEVRPSWLMDWRWLSAAAAVVAAFAIFVVYSVRRPGQLVRINKTSNAPLVAMNKAEPASSNLAETNRSEVREVEPNVANKARSNTPATGTPNAFAKKVPSVSVPPMAESLAVVPPKTPARTKQVPSQLADSANLASNKLSSDLESRQAPVAGAAGRALMRSTQEPQRLTQLSQMPVGVAPSTQAEGQRAAAGAAPMIPAAGASGGALPQAKAMIQGGNTPVPVVTTRVADVTAGELQTVEQRASGKVIDTPIPSVKWRFDSAGYVERSTDEGATWNGQEVDPAGGLLAGSAPNEKVCWVVGRKGVIYVTKDGVTWTKLKSPDSADLVEVTAKNASSAVVKTADGRRFSTQDRGKKWKLEAGAEDSTPP